MSTAPRRSPGVREIPGGDGVKVGADYGNLLGWLNFCIITGDPCLPRTWPGYEAVLRRPEGEYRIVVENPTE